MRRTRILGTGFYVPEKVVTNEDLSKLMNTSDEWITQRTGIKERRYVSEGVGASDLALEASRMAIQNAGLTVHDIDFIILGTLSPDYTFPGSAVLLQDKLGAPTIGALDIRNQCSGFIYGLSIADQFIRTGVYKHVLLVGTEVHSTGIEFSDRGRDVTVIFGDGAGAVVLGPTEDKERGILSTHLHSEGKYAKKLWIEAPGSIYHPRMNQEMLDNGAWYPKMDGKYVFKHAVTRMQEVIEEGLQANNLKPQDIALLVPHQANMRINQMVSMAMEIPEERVYHNIQRYGNTTAASIPIALHEALQEGKVQEGNIVVLAAFGSGFTWASAIIRW
jgi:3-oxoacyl-[acyl-carrier-protein] synthase-3